MGVQTYSHHCIFMCTAIPEDIPVDDALRGIVLICFSSFL